MISVFRSRFHFTASIALLMVFTFFASNVFAKELIRLPASPSVSPDGSQVVFSWRGDIWTVATEGGTARRLTNHPANDLSPMYSPDGSKIAFLSNRADGHEQVFTMNASGDEVQQITHHTEGYMLNGWYPDGEAVLTSGQRDHFWLKPYRLLKVDVTKRAAEKVLFDGAGYLGDVSPDGKKILFQREGSKWWRKGYTGTRAGQIWQYDTETKKFKKLIHKEGDSRQPKWSPDGKGFYYLGNESGSQNLWYYELETKESRQLTTFSDDSVLMPMVSADGSTVVFRHRFDLYALKTGENKSPTKIEIFAEDDAAPAEVIRDRLTRATGVTFSENGSDIAFVAGGDLWVMDTELREPRQVTKTAQGEFNPLFSPDGKRIVFISDAEGQRDIWEATRSDEKKAWWDNETFVLKRLTNTPDSEAMLTWSPKGDRLAFVKNRSDLCVMNPDGGDVKVIVDAWGGVDYDWSPDGKWFVYAILDEDDNRDIWVRPTDGSQEPVNISCHPRNEEKPVWSPDGKIIAFVGNREGEGESDIFYVYLDRADEERSSRDRKLEAARAKYKKNKDRDLADLDEPEKKEEKKPEPKKEAKKTESKKSSKSLPMDLDRIFERVHRIRIKDASEKNLLWSHDSKKLAFETSIKGKRGTYTVEFPGKLSPKLLSTKTGAYARWVKRGNQITWLSGGVPGTLSSGGSAKSYGFTALHELDRANYYTYVFDVAWGTMRNRFYDPKMNNRNWDEVRRKYHEVTGQCHNLSSLGYVINLMLGELNASHMGFTPFERPYHPRDREWQATTVHLGLRFDPEYKGPGLKVRDVLTDGPTNKEKSRVAAGEIVQSINGMKVDPDMDLTTVLNVPLDRDVKLTVLDKKGKARDLRVRPITFDRARDLVYEDWIRDCRAKVDKLSGGKLGYLHISKMSWENFRRFEHDLYVAGAGKDGLIIDVRYNPGGMIADYLLTAITQPVHSTTIFRGGKEGYPQNRMVYATWTKPILVLCNHYSGSNAEIFSHAIKTLKRGKVVGVETAGAVISTWELRLPGIGHLRVPSRAWFVLGTGEDMEKNGAVPDVVIWPKPCEMSAGIDRQLEKGVEVLGKDVKKWQSRPRPRLRWSSER